MQVIYFHSFCYSFNSFVYHIWTIEWLTEVYGKNPEITANKDWKVKKCETWTTTIKKSNITLERDSEQCAT
jgi:hypothetical protein